MRLLFREPLRAKTNRAEGSGAAFPADDEPVAIAALAIALGTAFSTKNRM
jgi:hypothetical protein